MTRPGHLRVTRTCEIPESELVFRVSRSGGPGGQHANVTNSQVEVVFDVEASPSLGPVQRRRLLEKVGPQVRAVSSDQRSQLRNKEVAVERLRAKLADALHVDKPRTATKPSRAAKKRRVEAKKRRGDVKRMRRSVEE